MRNTKEITTGAMLLAIFGAMLLIDRQFSFFLTEILVLAAPVLIIVFGNMYNLKDGLIFSIALLLISFIVSPSVYSYFYLILGTIIGNIYNLLLKKGVNTKIILLGTIVLFIIADICYAIIVSPLLLNQPFENEIQLMKDLFTNMFPQNVLNSLSEIGLSIDEFIETVTLASFVLTGIMEGVFIHLVSIMLLKRFKISTPINMRQFVELKSPAAYILFICASLMFFLSYIKNTVVSSIVITISAISLFILAYYGYVYLLMYFRLRYKRNNSLFLILAIVILFPLSVFFLFIIGFLYGSGPLKKYLFIERNKDE